MVGQNGVQKEKLDKTEVVERHFSIIFFVLGCLSVASICVASKREKEKTVIVDNCHCSSEGGVVSIWPPRRKGGGKRLEKKW